MTRRNPTLGGATRKAIDRPPRCPVTPVLFCACGAHWPQPFIGPQTTMIIVPCACGALIRWNIGLGWRVESVVKYE